MMTMFDIFEVKFSVFVCFWTTQSRALGLLLAELGGPYGLLETESALLILCAYFKVSAARPLENC